jgi:hypothetical protein
LAGGCAGNVSSNIEVDLISIWNITNCLVDLEVGINIATPNGYAGKIGELYYAK